MTAPAPVRALRIAPPLPETPTNPRKIVAGLAIKDLAWVVSGSGRYCYAYLDDELGIRFVCPSCKHYDHNGGAARLIDELGWYCHRCDRKGTRYGLELYILKDYDLLTAALQLAVADG